MKQSWPLIKRVVRCYLRPHLRLLFLALGFMALAAAMTAGFAVMIEHVIDEVLVVGNTSTVWLLAGTILVIFIVRGLSTFFHTVTMNKIGQTIVAAIQKDMFAHFLSLDLMFFHDHPSGQLMSRVVNDANAMRVAVSDSLTGIGKSLLTLLFLVGVMFYQDWKLALAAFIIFPFASFFVAWIGRRLRKMSLRIQSDMASLSDQLSQVFHGIRLVLAYGMEEREKDRIGKAIDSVKRLNIKAVRIGNLSTPVNELLVGLVVFGIVVYGGYEVAAGQSTPGELMSFITAFIMAYEPMKKLARLNNTLQMGLGATQRVFEIMDVAPAVADRPDGQGRSVRFKQPGITFEDVSFHYESAGARALDHLSLEIPPGKVSALVGPSGSGKSTIMNMIPRFFDPARGRICIEGEDVRDMTLESLRANIALVSQEITIFDDTVWANIGYGREGAYQDEIIKAAIAAQADGFIRELPQGYDTRLGEEGVRLSGGQRQRIAIARAILRDAPILLLDEATSALDNEAERAIQATLTELQKGRTTLVIAHRLSTVQNADQVIVLQKGQVVERGTHRQLMGRAGIYARMYGAGLKD